MNRHEPSSVASHRHERLSVALRGIQAAAANTLIALGLTLFEDKPFGQNFLYSQLIGLSIWILIEVGLVWLIKDWDTQWRRLALIVPPCVVTGYALGTLAGDALTGRVVLQFWSAQPRRAFALLTLSLAAGSIITYYFLSRERLAALRERELAAQRLAAESRLKLLQTQLDPHMLFNTLANLRALIGVDPPRSQQMLDHLIAYLRATLDASRSTTHALAVEFERLRDYLALMAVRMGPRLTYVLRLPPELAQQPVPALLLQPLVENSVLHGLEPKVEGGSITVAARRDGGDIVLEVSDTGVGLPAAPGAGDDGERSGFGLTQVRERLSTLYGASSTVEWAPACAHGTRVTVRFPCKT